MNVARGGRHVLLQALPGEPEVKDIEATISAKDFGPQLQMYEFLFNSHFARVKNEGERSHVLPCRLWTGDYTETALRSDSGARTARRGASRLTGPEVVPVRRAGPFLEGHLPRPPSAVAVAQLIELHAWIEAGGIVAVPAARGSMYVILPPRSSMSMIMLDCLTRRDSNTLRP